MPATNTAPMTSVLALDSALAALGLPVRTVARAMYNHVWARLDGAEFVCVNVVGHTVEVTRGTDGVGDRELAAKISTEINKFGHSTRA